MMNVEELEKKANEVRKDVIKMLEKAASGHSAGSLGMADIFTALYFSVMNHNPEDPSWDGRDRLFLSAGHIAPVYYAVLAHAGYFDKRKLSTLRKLGSDLQGHPERARLPGLESTSGPLGSGLAQAAGYAYAARMDKKRFRTFCICSDGEHQEGNHWEAVMFAGKYQLSNLTVFVDRNNIQIDGYTEEVMPLEPLKDKYEAFNWHVLHINGHNMQEIVDAVGHARAVYEKPTAIICQTVPGKGVSFMENKFQWHGKPPSPEEAKQAQKELKNLGVKIASRS